MQGWEGARLELKSCLSGSHASPKGVGVCGLLQLWQAKCCVAARPFCPVQHSVFTMWWELVRREGPYITFLICWKVSTHDVVLGSHGAMGWLPTGASRALASEHLSHSSQDFYAGHMGLCYCSPCTALLVRGMSVSPSGLVSPQQTV